MQKEVLKLKSLNKLDDFGVVDYLFAPIIGILIGVRLAFYGASKRSSKRAMADEQNCIFVSLSQGI